ncbi:hypothetical protein EYR36_010017 [Pleurotus pulmonarius]|nr:hypothetical protein EYR36_010017 [Pleurotus pulmonarius]KAF4593493.1 hypothetical protein EYR38_009208 [Pleurotus pulmonarius]
MVIIPQEVLREIIALVDDTPSLVNCLLVSKGFQFQDEARRALYESVALVATGTRLAKFRHALDANPLNAQLVAHIAFSHAWTWSQHHYRDMNYILAQLPNLATLEIRQSDWKWEDFAASLGPERACPWKLRKLIWYGAKCPLPLIAAHKDTLEHFQPSYETSRHIEERGLGLRMPNLRSMRLTHPNIKPRTVGMRQEEWKAVYSTIRREDGGHSGIWVRRG